MQTLFAISHTTYTSDNNICWINAFTSELRLEIGYAVLKFYIDVWPLGLISFKLSNIKSRGVRLVSVRKEILWMLYVNIDATKLTDVFFTQTFTFNSNYRLSNFYSNWNIYSLASNVLICCTQIIRYAFKLCY